MFVNKFNNGRLGYSILEIKLLIMVGKAKNSFAVNMGGDKLSENHSEVQRSKGAN